MVSFDIPTGLLFQLGLKLMPPVIEFGDPVQRAKGEAESFWHIPVSIHPGGPFSMWPRSFGPATMHGCEISLDKFDNAAPPRFRLRWGDAFFDDETKSTATLRRGHTELVPIAFRSEHESDGKAYWAEERFFTKKEKALPITADRTKRYFRLRVKSGNYERSSPLYQLRVPLLCGNGHFVVEKVYDQMTDSEAREYAKLQSDTSLYESDLNELKDALLLLSARIDQRRLYIGNRPAWELTFSFYNGSRVRTHNQ